jgi:hypothetical protein
LDFEITKDSRAVLAHGSIGGFGDLRHMPIDGSQSSSSVSGLLAGAISAFAPSPLGTEAIYITDSLTAGMENLYIAPMDASTAPQLLTPDMVLEGDVRSFGLASSKSRLARSHSPTQIVTAEAPPGD